MAEQETFPHLTLLEAIPNYGYPEGIDTTAITLLDEYRSAYYHRVMFYSVVDGENYEKRKEELNTHYEIEKITLDYMDSLATLLRRYPEILSISNMYMNAYERMLTTGGGGWWVDPCRDELRRSFYMIQRGLPKNLRDSKNYIILLTESVDFLVHKQGMRRP